MYNSNQMMLTEVCKAKANSCGVRIENKVKIAESESTIHFLFSLWFYKGRIEI